ncbi:MAG: PAS domain S-box protein [Bacteroidales bacterium]|nr:PAS domain S-box protein [Bacteroidales bacterium]
MKKANSILVINNDKDILTNIKSELTKNGYLTCAENNSKDALETLSSIQTDIIIIDVEVLKKSEIDLFNEIRSKKQYADTPIFLSANAKDEEVKQLVGTKGIIAVLENPLNIEEIFLHLPQQNSDTENKAQHTIQENKAEDQNQEDDIFNINNNSENGLLRFKYTINHSSASIIITDKFANIQYVNAKYCEQTGYAKEELIGQNPKILSAGTTAKEQYTGLWKTILDGQTWTGELQNKKKSGELFWEKATITPVKNNLGQISHFIAVKEDITQRKNKELEIEELKITTNKINEQIEKNELLFKSIFNNSIDCKIILDKDFNYLNINDLYAKTHQKKLADFVGKNYFEIFPSNLKDDFEQAKISKKIFRKNAFPFVFPDQPDLGITYYDIVLTPILDKNRQIQMFILSLNNVTKNITEYNHLKNSIIQIEQSENKYKQLTKSITDLFFALDEQLNITFWNNECEKLTKIKSINAIGENITNIFSDIQNTKYNIEKYQQVINTQKDINFSNKININNNLYYYNINVSPFLNGISVYMHDITEQKQQEFKIFEAKEAAEKQKNILKMFFENMSQGLYLFQIIHNETDNHRDYKYILINKALEKITGINAKLYLNKTAKTVLPKIDQTLLKNLDKAAITNNVISFEYYSEETQKYFNVLINPHQKDFLSVIYIDITESVNLEKNAISVNKKFKNFETKHKRIINSMFAGYCLLNENSEIIEANEQASNILGFSKDEILNKNFIENEKFENLSEIKKQFNISEQKNKTYFETKYKQNNNKIIDLIIYLEYNPTKEYKYIVNFQDITEKNRNITEIINDKNKAIQNNDFKTNFLINLSHAIKTPLNGIIGFSDFLQQKNLKPEKKSNYIQVIKNSSQQLIKIIDEIIEISKLTSQSVELTETEVCLNDILVEQFSFFDLKAKKNNTPIYIKKELSDIESTIIIDENKLSRIINILLDNAITYTNLGHIEIGYKLNNENIDIYVKDTGIGISEQKKLKIFDPFSKKDANTKNDANLGLGLAIAKEYSTLIGSEIKLESTVDIGSTFSFAIPYKPVYLEKEISTKNTKTEKDKKSFTIVVAEDEEINFLYIETLLESFFDLNCKIISCINGIETVDVCLKESNIDLILMDLKMPDLDGFEATRKIKKLRPQIPIIAQTAFASYDEKQKAFLAGCDDFITKPIKKEALKSMLKKFLIIND